MTINRFNTLYKNEGGRPCHITAERVFAAKFRYTRNLFRRCSNFVQSEERRGSWSFVESKEAVRIVVNVWYCIHIVLGKC